MAFWIGCRSMNWGLPAHHSDDLNQGTVMKESGLSRRTFLSGLLQPPVLHISSAVVSVLPQHLEDVAERLSALPEEELHHRSQSKLVNVLEGQDSGELGARHADI